MAKICPVCGTEFTDESAFCPSDGSTLRSKEAESDLVGQVIADRYLVQRKLGEGGMGAVYLAKHVRLPKQAAIKVLRPEMLADAASVARFNQEAANASQIEHEGVARVFDFGETADGTVYLAMEYVAGRSLRDVLDQDGALDLATTAAIVRQVAGGLDAAHRLGIVHRDLKPDNILVAQDEGTTSLRCKVVDFGIAKAIGAGASGQQLTRTGMVVGTPEFMSPEQLLAGELDHRSDVYALALVAYQCLTLDLPFDLRAPDRGMTARLVSQPRGLAAVRPDLPWPKSLQQVFDQGLDRDPDQRTPSAGAFADAFDDAVAEALGQRPPNRAGARAGQTASQTTGRSATGSTSTSVNGASSANSGANGHANRSGTSTSSAGETRRAPRWMAIAAVVVVLAGGGAWWALNGRSSSPSATTPTATAPAVTDSAALSGATPGRSGSGSGSGGQVADRDTKGGTNPASGTASGTAPGTAPGNATRGTGTPAGGANQLTSAPAAASSTSGVANAAGNASGNASSADAARVSLDSLEKALSHALEQSTTDDESTRIATAAVPQLQRLMTRLGSATDSAWAYLRMVEAHTLLNDTRSACAALRLAQRTANTQAQIGTIRRDEGMLTCK